MTDDSPWQDIKDARDGVNKAAKGIDDFATHSTSKVIGPMATKALEASKRAMKRWFEPDDVKEWRHVPRPHMPKQEQKTAWSFSGMFLKLFGHDPESEATTAPDAAAAPPEAPTETESFDV